MGNQSLMALQPVLDKISALANDTRVQGIVSFIASAFSQIGSVAIAVIDFILAGARAVYGFVSAFTFVLELLSDMAKVIDTLFGSNISDAISGFNDRMNEWIDKGGDIGKQIGLLWMTLTLPH